MLEIQWNVGVAPEQPITIMQERGVGQSDEYPTRSLYGCYLIVDT